MGINDVNPIPIPPGIGLYSVDFNKPMRDFYLHLASLAGALTIITHGWEYHTEGGELIDKVKEARDYFLKMATDLPPPPMSDPA